jgi:hypothetical protein
MSWWILRLGILIFLLIPGSVPLTIGYFVSLVYRFVDPNFIVVSFIRELYNSTLGTFPLLVEIVVISLVALSIVLPYLKTLRRKNPDKTLGEIGLDEFDRQFKKLQKPERTGKKSIEVSVD